MFDILGGRKCTTLGCAIVSMGLTILAGLLQVLNSFDNDTSNKNNQINNVASGRRESIRMIKPSVETILFAVGVVACDIRSFFVNAVFYGFYSIF